jgi:multicomponent Na+:H+ antiporter subunit A
LTEDVYPGLATGAALLSNALMAAIAATLTLRPFWGGQGRATPEAEAPWQMWLGPLALGLVSIGFGMIPDTVGRWLVEPAVLAFHSTTEDIKLKLFYGFNEPLLLSMLTLLLGGVTYAGRRRVRGVLKKLTGSVPLSMQSVYDGLDKATIAIARWQTRILQSGSLFQYLVVIIGSWVLMVGYALLASADLHLNPFLFPESAWLALLILSMAVGIGVVVVTRSRLLAICALGVIGAGMSMIFFAFGAPDVGLTQLLVETLTLIIAAIVLLRLPRVGPTQRHNGAQRVLRLATALSGGALVTALLMSVNHFELDRSVSDFYEKASYLEAHGRNIVNVILVDFRSLDTLGEIIVVAASALGILALIQRERKAP